MLVNLVFQRISSPIFTRIQALRAELSEVAHESFDGAQVVKTLGREQEETDRFRTKAHQLRDEAIHAGRVRAAFDPLLEGLPNLGVLAVLGVGVARVGSGAADPGDVVVIAYLLTIVAFPIRSIGWVLGEFPRSVVGYERSTACSTRPSAPSTASAGCRHRATAGPCCASRGSASATTPTTACSTTSTSTSRPTHRRRGGRDGLGQEHPDVVGDPPRRPRRGSAHPRRHRPARPGPRRARRARRAGPQSAFLFDDTVRDNVTLGAPVADEEVWEALRTAQADGFVAALPRGLDSRLGERGTSLSGGQRQRLSLARALLHRPRLLVLDDATSAVDPEVEARILAGVRKRSGETTMLLVAYRKATIALADEVLFLADGRIADRGPHADLLARRPDYALLVNAYDTEDVPS